MYCNKCGKNIADDSKFCDGCGHNFDVQSNVASAKMPKKKSKVLRTVIIIIIFIAIISIIINATKDKNDSNDAGTGGVNNYNYIGDTVTVGNVQYLVNAVNNVNAVGNEILGDSTDNNFVLIDITIKNNTNEEITISSSWFYLFKGSAKYEVHSSGIYIENGFYIIETLGSGLSKSIVLLYETPDTTNDASYELEVNKGLFSSSKRIILENKQ